MKSQIGLIGIPQPMPVKESYITIKRRLFNESDFIEVTNSNGKMTISKSIIGMIAPIFEKDDDKKVSKPPKNR